MVIVKGKTGWIPSFGGLATSMSNGRFVLALAPTRPISNAIRSSTMMVDMMSTDCCRPACSFLCMDGGFRVIAKLSFVSMVDVHAVYNTC